MPAKQWYFRGSDGTIHGPLSGVELREQARSGWVGPGSFVMSDSSNKWVVAGQVKGLFPERAGDPGRSASMAAVGHRRVYASHQESAPNNVLAIVSAISGVLGYVVAPVIGPAVAIITGHVALHQIERSEGREDGKILAVIGLLLGYIQAVVLLSAAIAVMFLGISVAGLFGLLLQASGRGGAPPARLLPIHPPPVVRPEALAKSLPRSLEPRGGAFAKAEESERLAARVVGTPVPARSARTPRPPGEVGAENERPPAGLNGRWDVTGPRLGRGYAIEFGTDSVTVRHAFGRSSIGGWSYRDGRIHFGGTIRVDEIKIQGPWEARWKGEDEIDAIDPEGREMKLKRRPS